MSINLNHYFTEKCYDGNFLNFLSIHDNGRSYYLTMPNDGKLDELYNVTMELKSRQLTGTKQQVFEVSEQQLKLLNRIAEQETNWIVYPLFIVAEQFYQISKTINSISELERCGRTIHRSFNLCLNDRNPTLPKNRRIGCYMFANLEFQLYHKLKNRDMMKNLVKVLQSRRQEIPTLRQSLARYHKSHMVKYNYYMGEYYGCYEGDFSRGHEYLSDALMDCSRDPRLTKKRQRIVILLVPMAVLMKKRPVKVPEIYHNMLNALKTGNLSQYDAQVHKNEIFYLENGLYVAMSLIRELVLLRLIKQCYRYYGSRNILPLSIIAIGYTKSTQRGKQRAKKLTPQAERELLDSLECQLANLIAKDHIKGYLSHSNRCIVLSKKNPFP